MKISIFTFFSILLYFNQCIAQKNEYKRTDKDGFTYVDAKVNSNYCLNLIKFQSKEILCRQLIGSEGNSLSQKFYKPFSEAKTLYGKECVIVIELKPGIEIVSLQDIFDKFKISKKDRILPVFVNKGQIIDPEKLYFVTTSIKSIEVVTSKSSKVKLISIITNTYSSVPKERHVG